MHGLDPPSMSQAVESAVRPAQRRCACSAVDASGASGAASNAAAGTSVVMVVEGGGGGGCVFGAPRQAGARSSVAERARFLPGMSV